jgi:hypothetical protein
LSTAGYEPVPDPNSSYPDRLRFAKPLDRISEMPQLLLDACDWQTSDDVFQAFLLAVGAPRWHGRNFDALNDSIGTGGINRIEAPYRIIIRNADSMSRNAAAFVQDFADLIKELQSNGCPVELRIERP